MSLTPARPSPPHGAIISNGNLYCPQAPRALPDLEPLARDATREDTAAHDTRTTELARYKLGRLTADDPLPLFTERASSGMLLTHLSLGRAGGSVIRYERMRGLGYRATLIGGYPPLRRAMRNRVRPHLIQLVR
jgi:hypothetical protein